MGGKLTGGQSDKHRRCEAAVGKAVGKDTQTGIMILALATRHRVERPAISMEGGTVFSYGAARPPPSGIAFEQIRDKKRSAQCKVRILSFIEKCVCCVRTPTRTLVL